MKELHSYVVRIFRREGDLFAGTVEQVRSGRVAPFATLDELCALISGQRRFAARPASAPPAPPPDPASRDTSL